MKFKNSVKILIGLTIALGIILIYGTSELIFQNNKANSPSIDTNNQTVVMENLFGEEIEQEHVEKPNKANTNNSPTINNTEIENNNDDRNESNENVEPNNIDNPNLDNEKSKTPEKIESPDNDDKRSNSNNKGYNNKNNNNKSNNKNNNNISDKDKPILENNLISEEKALEIGFKKVGSGGVLENIKSNLDDNPPKYIIQIVKNKQKYKFEIHARTGAVLEYKKEKIK